MIITCILSVAVNVSGIPFLTTAQVQGKVLKENNRNYLVDFSQGLKKYPKVQIKDEYKNYLISKDKCI